MRERAPNEERETSDVIRSQNEGGNEKLAGERIAGAREVRGRGAVARARWYPERIILSRSHHTNCRDKSPYTLWDESFFCTARSLRRGIYHPRLSIYYRPRRLPSLLCRVNTRCAETNSLRERTAPGRRSDSSSRLRQTKSFVDLDDDV